jgi:Protein of unknown function (DUF1566)
MKSAKSMTAAFALAALCLPAFSAPPLINDTAATICYDSSGSGLPLASCAGSREDGAYGRDVTAPNPSNGDAGFRFARVCNNGQEAGVGSCPSMPGFGAGPTQWACTIDKVSGLLWELKTTDGSDRDEAALFGYLDHPVLGLTGAVTYAATVSASGLCGATDWRVPSHTELMTIAHYGIASPAPRIDPTFFPNTPTDAIANWTSTTYNLDGTYKRQIGFGTGGDGAGPSFQARHVRLVRGSPLSAVQRFTTISSGTGLKDPLTGLVWRRCAEGSIWNGSECVGTPTLVTWAGALQLAANAGGSWRLPNISELVTLLRGESHEPCSLLPEPFPVLASLWSNTPSIGGMQAWSFDQQNNSCVSRLTRPVTDLGEVRLVRAY